MRSSFRCRKIYRRPYRERPAEEISLLPGLMRKPVAFLAPQVISCVSFIVAVVGGFEDISVVGEAFNGLEAIRLYRAKQPDVTLMDVQMP